jgi:hypothetical protein
VKEANMSEWYGQGCNEELLDFLEVLYSLSIIGAETLLYALRKPWKWTPEYKVWVEHGKPTESGTVALSAFYVAVRDSMRGG